MNTRPTPIAPLAAAARFRARRRAMLFAGALAAALLPAAPAFATVGMRIDAPEGLDPRQRPDAVAGNVLWVVSRLTAEMLADELRLPAAARLPDRLDAMASAALAGQALDFFIPGAAAAVAPREALKARPGLAEPAFWSRIGFDTDRAAASACLAGAGIHDVTAGDWTPPGGVAPARSCIAGHRLAAKRWEDFARRHPAEADEPALVLRFEKAGRALEPYRVLFAESEITEAFQERLAGVRLPRRIALVGRECGKADAFWDRKRGEMVLCYELVRFFGALTAGDAPADPADPAADAREVSAGPDRHVRLEDPVAAGTVKTWAEMLRASVPDLARRSAANASLFGTLAGGIRALAPETAALPAGTRLESYGSARVLELDVDGRRLLAVHAEFAVERSEAERDGERGLRRTNLLVLVDPADRHRVLDAVQTGHADAGLGGFAPDVPLDAGRLGPAFLMTATGRGWEGGIQRARHLVVAVRDGRFETVGGVETLDRETCGRAFAQAARLAAEEGRLTLAVTLDRGRDPTRRCIPGPVTSERFETVYGRDGAGAAWSLRQDGFAPLAAFNATVK